MSSPHSDDTEEEEQQAAQEEKDNEITSFGGIALPPLGIKEEPDGDEPAVV